MACAAQCNQVISLRSDGLLIKGKYSLAKIFVMNSHLIISACLNRDYCFSFFFWGGGGGRIHSTADCALSFLGIGIRFYISFCSLIRL